jgi:hypothetical protein
MTKYSIDILYAYAQLGLEPGASQARIAEVLTHAAAYTYWTQTRIKHLKRFVNFFSARQKLGKVSDHFTKIKSAYHQRAMELHPDRNQGKGEEAFKDLNAAFELVRDIYREAETYFQQSEEIRRDIEQEAREATRQEAPQEAAQKPKDTSWQETPRAYTYRGPHAENMGLGTAKYMAASIPRYIRTSRLFYLPRQAIIGSRLMQPKAGTPLMYDIVMLPEDAFKRARLSLGMETAGSMELNMSRWTPTYIPRDTREVHVPPEERDPYRYAKNYFLGEFGLEQRTMRDTHASDEKREARS